MSMKEKFAYSVSELANLINVGKITVYRMVKKNELPGMYRIGDMLRFKKIEIDAWIDAGGSQEKIQHNNKGIETLLI